MSQVSGRTEIIRSVGERKKREYAELPQTQPCQKKKRAGVVGAMRGVLTPKTNLRHFKDAVLRIRSKPDFGGDPKTLQTYNEAFSWFDSQYRPYVFYLLKRRHGFSYVRDDADECGNPGQIRLRNKVLDAESVYAAVVEKLVEVSILKFDLENANLGKGAFRKWLSKVVESVYSDAIDPYLVPMTDEKGNIVYRLDKNGNPILKKGKKEPVRVFRPSADKLLTARAHGDVDGDDGETAVRSQKGIASGSTGARTDWTLRSMARIRKRTMCCAYLIVTEKQRGAKAKGWSYEAMVDLFEKDVDEALLGRRLLANHTIRDMGTLHVAKTRFLDAWKERAEKLERPLLERALPSGATQNERSGYEKSKRKGTYVWRPLVSFDEALRIVRDIENDTKDRVGPERFRTVVEHFDNTMLMLMLEADQAEAKKNAWRYGV